jgi:hypothetical protein
MHQKLHHLIPSSSFFFFIIMILFPLNHLHVINRVEELHPRCLAVGWTQG